MLTTQERAEVYRLGVIIGMFEVPEVIRWADEVIAAEDKVDNAMLEISMAGDANTAKMATLLRDAAGEQRPGKPRDVIFGLLGKQLTSDASSAGSVAARLKTLRSAYDAPDATLLKAADLATPFGQGDDDHVTREMTAFLTPYASAAAEW